MPWVEPVRAALESRWVIFSSKTSHSWLYHVVPQSSIC
jgi:hypothetical protein